MASVATLTLCLALPVSALAAETANAVDLEEPNFAEESVASIQDHSPSMSDGADDWSNPDYSHPAISMSCDENGVPIEETITTDAAPLSAELELPEVVSEDIVVETEEATPDASNLPLLASVPFDAELQWRIFEEVCHGDKTRFCLLMAIGSVESGFNPSARSGNTYGWLQILLSSHRSRIARLGYAADDLFDPVKCSVVALDYINGLMGYPSSLEVTHRLLMAYNMGAGGAAAAIKKGNTTSVYSRKVMPLYERYLAEFTLA